MSTITTHAVSVGSVSRRTEQGQRNGYRAECSCSWTGREHLVDVKAGAVLLCSPAPALRAYANRDAVEHQREARQ